MKKKIAWGIAILLGCGLIYVLVAFIVPIGLLIFSAKTAKVTVIDEPSHYYDCLGGNADETYGKSFDELFEVFPHSISNTTDVKEFKYVYYNPWDPQYISYMTIQYNEDEYSEEIDRLNQIGIDDYNGIYSVTGSPKGYKLVALKADTYKGFGYAIIPESCDNSITYVGIDFCNYFLDLDINEYVPKEYLLSGFDATLENPYRKSKMKRQ